MTAALEEGEWSAARPGRTLPPGKTRCPFYRRLCGSQGRSGRAENLVPTGIRSRTIQSVAQSLYRLSYRAHIQRLNIDKKIFSNVLFYGSKAPLFLGPLTFQILRSHTDKPYMVGLLWTNDQPMTETSTRQHVTITSDRPSCPGEIRNRNPRKRAAADPRHKARGHGKRQ